MLSILQRLVSPFSLVWSLRTLMATLCISIFTSEIRAVPRKWPSKLLYIWCGCFIDSGSSWNYDSLFLQLLNLSYWWFICKDTCTTVWVQWVVRSWRTLKALDVQYMILHSESLHSVNLRHFCQLCLRVLIIWYAMESDWSVPQAGTQKPKGKSAWRCQQQKRKLFKISLFCISTLHNVWLSSDLQLHIFNIAQTSKSRTPWICKVSYTKEKVS